MTDEQAIDNLQRLRKAYIDRHTLSELKKKSVKDDIVSYDIAIQAIKDLDKMNGIALDLASENDELIEKLDSIRAEIEINKKGFPPSSDYYKAITRAVNIIDNYRGVSKDADGD